MKKKKIIQPNNLVIYQAKNGAIQFRGDFTKETIWATQAQIAEVFNTTPQNITLHLKNIFKDKELDPRSTCKEFLQVQIEGNRTIKRQVKFYSLDIILAVGYRTNSAKAIEFRKWATKVLHDHLVSGFTVNKSRIAENYDQFMKIVADVRALLPKKDTSDTDSILELISIFADTWMSLDAFDKENFTLKKPTKKKVALTAEKLNNSIALLKEELIKKGEATDLFATARDAQAIQGIVGNVMQSFGGSDLYPSIEEKAAHLLYFIVKNHPFLDGNKRSGAYAFVWFLNMAKILDTNRVTPVALTALTLLIAESDPKHKEKMIGMVVVLLGRGVK
jgi:prophage maintenance system killer protein